MNYKKTRLKSIDGFKGIACLIIAFVTHYPVFYNIENLALYTSCLVEVFVAISGFGMAYSYKDKIINLTFYEYFWTRYLKIMPLYWLCFIICLIFQVWAYVRHNVLLTTGTLNLSSLILDFLGVYCGWFAERTPINAASWMVHVLFLCYILYFIICKISKCSRDQYFLLITGMLILSLVGIGMKWNRPFLFWESSLRVYSSFAIGLLLYEMWSVLTITGGVILSVFGWMFIGGGCFAGYFIKGSCSALFGDFRILTILLICPLVLLTLIYMKPVSCILSMKWAQNLGNISMSVYLWHTLFRSIISFTVLDNSLGGLLIYIVSTMGISVISHYFIEPVLYRWIRRGISIVVN